MVVKGALGDAASNPSTIANNTRGMVFLGTPFHGSPVAPWGKAISSMVSAIIKTDPQKVKDLDQKSEKLKILAESFASALNQRIRDSKEIRVAFFHETKKLHGFLVSRQATYPSLLRQTHLQSPCRLFPNRTLGYLVSEITRLSTQTTPPCVNSPTRIALRTRVCWPPSRGSQLKKTRNKEIMFVNTNPITSIKSDSHLPVPWYKYREHELWRNKEPGTRRSDHSWRHELQLIKGGLLGFKSSHML